MTIRIDDILAWKYKPEDGYLWQAGETYDSIEWRCDLPKPNEDQLKQDAIEYASYQQSIQYKNDRLIYGYAPIGDQLDMQYHDLINGTTTWRDHISSVKQRYPKPS